MRKVIKFDTHLIKKIALFESISRVKAKDCFEMGQTLYFVVPDLMMGKAIGKGSQNIKKIEKMFNKKVRLVAYTDNITNFIKKLVYPLQLSGIEENEGVYTLMPADLKTRGMLIGRGGQNLRQYEEIAKRYFDIKEIKVK